MLYKIAQLSLSPGSRSNTAGDIFIAQPDTIKEELAGKLFIMVEIEQNTSTSIKIINYLIDTINHNYYQNEKILLRERISTLKVEHIFEAILAKTNKFFSDFLNTEKINLAVNDINITAGVIHDNELHFANSGKNKVFLVYEQKNKDNTNERPLHKIVDITKQASPEHGNNKISKLFSNVVSGPIPRNGIIVVSNEALPEYISNNKLMEIVTTLPPMGAVEQMKNTLSSINSYVSFSGIIIKNNISSAPADQRSESRRSTEKSIVDLNRTEETTENLLTPSGLINFKKWLRLPAGLFNYREKGQKNNYGKQLNLKDKIIVKKKTSNILRQIRSALSNLVSFTFKAFRHGFSLLSGRKKLSSLKNSLSVFFKNKLDRFFSWIFGLSKKSKALLVAGIFLLIFFSYNLSIMKTTKEADVKQENFEEISLMIEQKQNQAEANLLYSNEEGAQKLFEEIKTLMDSLPRETDEQIEKFNEFKEKFDNHTEKIRRLSRLPAQEIADFSNLNNEAEPVNISFVGSSNKIYSADSKQRSIYILDANDNTITTITDLSLPIIALGEPANNNNENLYYINGNNIINFSLAEEQLTALSLETNGKNIENIDVYNGRLYALYSQDSSIMRYNRSGSSFGSPYNWLSGSPDLTKAVDISIDGHIYVLTSDGSLLKFLTGDEVDFKLEQVDPPLTEPTKLFVSPEGRFIYVMEPKEQRLVVYDKDGQFIIQYTSDSFNDLRDFQINETNGEMYFLNATKVLKLQAEHFNEG